MFDVKTTDGIATANVNGKYMDAAVVGSTAGLEFSADRVHCSDAPRSTRHADLVVSLDMHPVQMLQMLSLLAEKLGLPAFNAREWRTVQAALREYDGLSDDNVLAMADLIDGAATKIEALYALPTG